MSTRSGPLFLATLLLFGAPGCGKEAPREEGRPESTAAFCEEHQIAEAQCPFCNPSLIESLGHCNGHGVPEAFCYQCNPALIPAFKAVGDWCGGHDRPESQCYICNPELDPARQEAPATKTSDATTTPGGSLAATAGPTRRLPRSQQPPSVTCATASLVVRFDSPEIADQAGLQFATVESRAISKIVECNAEVAYDGNRYAQIAAQVPGLITEVHRDLGDFVEAGAALVTITSTHLGAAKASYLQAVAAVALWERNHAREADLLERGISTEPEVLAMESRLAESRISLSEAEQALLGFGLSRKQIDESRQNGDTSARYVIRAPFSGVVVDRHSTIGEVVDSSKPMFALADISHMWGLIDVYESNVQDIKIGQPVVLQVEALPGQPFAGRITWVSSQLDPQTRTLGARAEFDNTSGLLRANMFAQAQVTVRDNFSALVVPASSVQWEGCCNVVFVRKSAIVYEPRRVHLGIATGTVYEVLSGVSQGEEVITQGSFLLKTEILKGSIGAGCCEVEPGA